MANETKKIPTGKQEVGRKSHETLSGIREMKKSYDGTPMEEARKPKDKGSK